MDLAQMGHTGTGAVPGCPGSTRWSARQFEQQTRPQPRQFSATWKRPKDFPHKTHLCAVDASGQWLCGTALKGKLSFCMTLKNYGRVNSDKEEQQRKSGEVSL